MANQSPTRDSVAAYHVAAAQMRVSIAERMAARSQVSDETSRADVSYEYIVTNLMHLAGLSLAAAQSRAALIVEEMVVTSVLDHSADFAPALNVQLAVDDPAGCIERAQAGQQFLFFGFHTGPYWSVGFHLVSRGLTVAALLPPHLRADKARIAAIADACADGSGGRMCFIDINDESFLHTVMAHLRSGHQILSFLDGTGGDRAIKPSRRDVRISFLDGELSLKTSMSRLAMLTRTPIVFYNGERRGHARRIVLDPPFLPRIEDDHSKFLQSSFDRLVSRLCDEPTQWEAWSYIHHYYSDAFRRKLVSELLHLVLWGLAASSCAVPTG
jgi:hypothetical protein